MGTPAPQRGPRRLRHPSPRCQPPPVKAASLAAALHWDRLDQQKQVRAAPRCHYLLRALPPSATAAFARRHDEAVLTCLGALLANDAPPELDALTVARAQLPLHYGGLGERNIARFIFSPAHPFCTCLCWGPHGRLGYGAATTASAAAGWAPRRPRAPARGPAVALASPLWKTT